MKRLINVILLVVTLLSLTGCKFEDINIKKAKDLLDAGYEISGQESPYKDVTDEELEEGFDILKDQIGDLFDRSDELGDKMESHEQPIEDSIEEGLGIINDLFDRYGIER